MILLMIGAPEIIFVAIIVLLLFGGKKIPELMRGLGKGVRQFKEGMKDLDPNNIDADESTEKNEKDKQNEDKENVQ